MGGIWGVASSSALENLPVEVRGLASGVLQQGYACGYLIAAVINLTVVSHSRFSWRTLFWTGAGITAFAALLRACLPESQVFLRAKALEREKGTTTTDKTRIFLHETKEMLKLHWKLCVYAVLLMTGKHPVVRVLLAAEVVYFWCFSMTGFNFLSHGSQVRGSCPLRALFRLLTLPTLQSQDLYPTYLEKTKGFSVHDATIATIIGNCVCVLFLFPFRSALIRIIGCHCVSFAIETTLSHTH